MINDKPPYGGFIVLSLYILLTFSLINAMI